MDYAAFIPYTILSYMEGTIKTWGINEELGERMQIMTGIRFLGA